MIQTNAEFDARNAALAKKPIYVLSIGGEARVYSTHDLAREGIVGAPVNHRAWLKTPRGASQSIDVLRGSSSIGELECEVIDPDGEMRALVGSTTLEGRQAMLAVGYPGMTYANFVRLHTYTIFKVRPSRHYTSWLIRARDRQLAMKRTVWAHPENGRALCESNPWILQGTPAEIVQAVYLFGLGRDPGELDLAGMRALDSGAEGLYKCVRPFHFVLAEAFEVKQFLESEVYRPSGLYAVVDNLGRISLRSFRPAAAGVTPVYTFTRDNTVVLPEIDRFDVVNEIVWKIDGGARELMYVEATSLSTFGRARQHAIESAGLRTAFGAQWWCQEVSQRLFRRFAGTPGGLKGGAPVATVEAFFLTLPVWAGDFVLVTHPQMPDMLTGALGVADRVYEVIDREPDYGRGRMQYKLLDTGLTGLQPARKWAPSDRDFIIQASEVY